MAPARAFAIAAFTLLALLVATDAVLRVAFPHFDRFADNFSTMYLEREVAAAAGDRNATIFLGDSVLWGYKLPPSASAPALLRATGCDCRNLSYEGGSPANTYALLRLLLAGGAAPKVVVFNVNQKEFNPADSSYATLYPSVHALAVNVMTADERSRLTATPPPDTNGAIEAAIARVWALYGMRTDIREAMFKNVDAVHALQAVIETSTGATARVQADHVASADRFEGTYDLTPLEGEPNNVSVKFLRDIGALTRAHRVAAIALLTPTNHRLLHDYIDTPAYVQNLEYAARLLRRYGVTVVDLDRAIPPDEFLDNDHLTAAGNRRLADLLRPVNAAR